MRNAALPVAPMPPVSCAEDMEPVEASNAALALFVGASAAAVEDSSVCPDLLDFHADRFQAADAHLRIDGRPWTWIVIYPPAVVGQEASQAAPNDADQFLATQIKLIQSDAVLRPVAEQYHLREAVEPSIDELRAKDAPVSLTEPEGLAAPEHVSAADQLPLHRPDAGGECGQRHCAVLRGAYLRHPLPVLGQSFDLHGEATGRTEGQDGAVQRSAGAV